MDNLCEKLRRTLAANSVIVAEGDQSCRGLLPLDVSSSRKRILQIPRIRVGAR